MLRITPAYSAQAATDYHLAGLARADYYMGQEPAVWQGKGAALLGLAGLTITRQDFAALAEGYHPLTGDKLIQRFRENRRVGYGLTFNVPKSLTLVYEYRRDERIPQAVNATVDEVMDVIERDMRTRSYDRHGTPVRPVTGNLIWAAFLDFESRPLASDGLPDPHLHCHAFAMAPTWHEDKQCWQAGEFGGIKADGAYYEALFHALLARRVRALGYDVTLTDGGRWWEIAGMSRRLIAKFSRRTAEIAEIACARGITDADELDGLGARTRQGKGDYSLPELRELWRARLSDEDIRELEQAGNTGAHRESVTAGEAVAFALDKTLERRSVVECKHLLTEALRYGAGQVTLEELLEALGQAHILTWEDGERTWVTTREVAEEEGAMCRHVREGLGACEPLIQSAVIGHQSPVVGDQKKPMTDIPATDDRIILSAGQQRAVDHILTSRDAVIAVRGVAGSGKTTLLREAVAAIGKGGKAVYSFAPTTAATDVLRQEGFAHADTLQKLLACPAMQARLKDQVVLVDEAGLVAVGQMTQLFDIAADQGARVILVGDEAQHGSVERSEVNVLQILRDEAGLCPAEVTEIKRQRARDYREAVSALSHADITEGFARLDAMGAIHDIPDHRERYERLAADYLEAVQEGQSALIIAPTHAEGRIVTGIVRQGLKAQGVLEAHSRTALRLKNLHWTVADRRHAAFYEAGMIVEFTQNAKGIRRGVRLTVAGHDGSGRVVAHDRAGTAIVVPLEDAERFQVYAEEELDLAVGDKVRITRNGEGLKGERLVNGAVATVAGFTADGHIELTDGTVVHAGYGHLDHGYVSTSHRAQGVTVDRVFIAEDVSYGAASPAQLYVSTSRARDAVRLYTDDKDALLHAVSRARPAMSASELVRRLRREENEEHAVQERYAYGRRMEQLHRLQRREQETRRLWPEGRLKGIWSRTSRPVQGLLAGLRRIWRAVAAEAQTPASGAPAPEGAGP